MEFLKTSKGNFANQPGYLGKLAIQERPGLKRLEIESSIFFSNCGNQGSLTSRYICLATESSVAKINVAAAISREFDSEISSIVMEKPL